MASKKTGRLAGLAALGLAAYMATRDKGGTKAAASAPAPAPAAKDARTYAEVHEDEDAQAGINMGTSAGRKMGEEMLARGEAEGKKIDSSDRFADPTKIKDTEFGDLEGAMKAQANAPTTPLTFGQTFRQARNAGDKTFTFNGKKYTTELAKPAAPAAPKTVETNKRGGVIKKMASGGMTSSASKRGDGIATKGKTRGRMC